MEELRANQKLYPKALLDQSLSKLSNDDVFLNCLHRISDLPKKLLKEVARSLSAYGLCLLEARSALEKCYMNELWKALYFRITNRFYEPLATTESPGIDMKDLYFQRAFHEILQCFSEEVESSCHLQMVFEEARLFSCGHSTLFSRNLERLSKLFKDHLVSIRIYPVVLKMFWPLLTRHLFQKALINVTSIELRDFKYFAQDQLDMLKRILNIETVPKLVSMKFVNCKFSYDAMEWFNQMNCEFCQEICDKQNLSMNMDIPCKVARVDTDEEISFDEAICIDHPCSGTPNENLFAWPDFEITERPNQIRLLSKLLKLAFVNCHFDEEALSKLCEVMQRLQHLKSFTFWPEWKCSLSFGDRILPSMLQVPTFCKLAMETTPNIMDIEIEDCPLGYYSQKLLLWHQAGECTLQHGILVPKLKHLKLVDCSIENFRVSCSCCEIKDFHSSLDRDSRDKLCHTEECNSVYVWKFDTPSTCSCNWLNLVSINLSDNKLGEKGAEALAKALKHSQSLQQVNLAYCSLNTKGCSFIFNLATDKRLSSLDVSNNSYDGREDSSLCQLIADGTVTELKLGSLFVPAGITAEIVRSFSKNSIIQALDLSRNWIGDPVFSMFVDILADPSTLSALKILNLEENFINPRAIVALAKLRETSNRKLDCVKFFGNNKAIEDELVSEIMRRRVERFMSEGSWPSHRVAIGMADHVSEM